MSQDLYFSICKNYSEADFWLDMRKKEMISKYRIGTFQFLTCVIKPLYFIFLSISMSSSSSPICKLFQASAMLTEIHHDMEQIMKELFIFFFKESDTKMNLFTYISLRILYLFAQVRLVIFSFWGNNFIMFCQNDFFSFLEWIGTISVPFHAL